MFIRFLFYGSLLFGLCLLNGSDVLASGGLLPDDPPAWQQNYEVRQNDLSKVSVFGPAAATREQAVNFIKSNNPQWRLNCSVKELVNYYWQEAGREGIRPDLALCQALVETGMFRFGGDVRPEQNNFCGLGTIGGGAKGAKFPTVEIGVRAHIQHLMAYVTERRPAVKIVDPRYEVVERMRKQQGFAKTWKDLDKRWAMSEAYSSRIFSMQQRMLGVPSYEANAALGTRVDPHGRVFWKPPVKPQTELKKTVKAAEKGKAAVKSTWKPKVKEDK